MAQEDSLRLAAEIVDKFSGPLRDMQKAIHSLGDSLKGAHTEGGKHAKEHAKHLEEASERTKELGRSAREIAIPALSALGISVLGVGETIAKLIEKLAEAGESFYKIQDAVAHTGFSNEKIQVYTKALEEMGIPADQARKSLSEMGDALARLGRNEPQERIHWSQTFNNIDMLVNKLHDLKTTSERMDAAFDFFKEHPNIPPDQKAKFFAELLHMPPELASITAQQWEEEIEHARDFFKEHPPLTLEEMKGVKDAFRELHELIEGYEQDILRAFAGSGSQAIKDFGEVIHHNVEDIHMMWEDLKAFLEKLDWVREQLGLKDLNIEKLPDMGTAERPFPEGPLDKNSPAYKLKQGMSPVGFVTGGGDAENWLSRAVKSGMLDAFREWFASVSAPMGEGGGSGIVNASYTPGGGAVGGFAGRGGGRGGRWGGGGYTVMPDGASDVPAGSGSTGIGGHLGKDRHAIAQVVADEWSKAGMSREGIAGLMQNLMDESGLNPNLRHPDQPNYSGEAHFAHGLYQEGGAEWNRYSAWLDKNYPGADWRNPVLQSRFAAWNLRTNYPGTWHKMLGADRFHAAADYVNEYLKPADRYRYSRMSHYLHGGVGSYESFVGQSAGAQLHDMIRRGGLHERGSSHLTGGADLRVSFDNAPPGTRARLKNWGLFADPGKIDWGYSMSPSNPGGN